MTFEEWVAETDSGHQKRHRLNMDWWRKVWDAAQAAQRETDAVMVDEFAEETDRGLEVWGSTQSYMRREGRRDAFRDAAAAIRVRGEAHDDKGKGD